MGEEFARSLERRAGKPQGWLDGVDDPLALLEPDERAIIERYRKADARGRRNIYHVADDEADYVAEQ